MASFFCLNSFPSFYCSVPSLKKHVETPRTDRKSLRYSVMFRATDFFIKVSQYCFHFKAISDQAALALLKDDGSNDL